MPQLELEERAAGGEPLSPETALAFANAEGDELALLVEAASAVRDRAFGKRVSFSPKVFLPVTNLCRNRCGYCSFRRSPGDAGEWTMSPDEVTDWIVRGREQGCAEALLCLGDKPESAFPTYRRQLAQWGHDDTVDYLVRVARIALEHGLLPHTNAGILTRAEMQLLRPVNVSLGLMLESTSLRLLEPGGAHHRAPDKHPEKRIEMIENAGELRIPFTSGILVGIGETRQERVESLLELRRLHRAHGHLQEVIVQAFRARPEIPMHAAEDPCDDDLAHAVAMARLILDDDVVVQAPPNLSPDGIATLLRAGVSDFGGISPVTPDYINPRHPWPHLAALGETCAREGFTLQPRLAIHDRYLDRPTFVDPSLRGRANACQARIARFSPRGAT
jgi:FO synthase